MFPARDIGKAPQRQNIQQRAFFPLLFLLWPFRALLISFSGPQPKEQRQQGDDGQQDSFQHGYLSFQQATPISRRSQRASSMLSAVR